jgi:hypothetical protein
MTERKTPATAAMTRGRWHHMTVRGGHYEQEFVLADQNDGGDERHVSRTNILPDLTSQMRKIKPLNKLRYRPQRFDMQCYTQGAPVARVTYLVDF